MKAGVLIKVFKEIPEACKKMKLERLIAIGDFLSISFENEKREIKTIMIDVSKLS